MKWIKASEQLPAKDYSFGYDEFGCFPVRWEFEYRKVLGIGYLDKETDVIHNAMNLLPLDLDDLEWLCEEEAPAQEWVSVEERLPEIGQIVDIWEMPMTETLKRNLSLKGSDYAKEYYHATDYEGWRSTNYKFSIEHDNEGEIKCFTKCIPRYFSIPNGGAQYRKLCVENGEVTHWQPLPSPPHH